MHKSSHIWLIPTALFLICGCFLAFAMAGRELVGYVCFLTAVLISIYHFLNKRHCRKLRLILSILLILAVIAFTIIEIPIIADSRTDADPQADYLVVLGAGVNGTVPSLSLINRLEAALDYLETYPASVVIVSGGQGGGEDITEAEAMRVWLEDRGIDPGRILKEERATSTEENLKFSFKIMESHGADPADGVAIVSSEYHLHRAKNIARALGAVPYGVAGETTLPLLKVNYFIREGLGAIYIGLFGPRI